METPCGVCGLEESGGSVGLCAVCREHDLPPLSPAAELASDQTRHRQPLAHESLGPLLAQRLWPGYGVGWQ